MRAARNKTKIRLIQNIKREITSRIKKKYIKSLTHSNTHSLSQTYKCRSTHKYTHTSRSKYTSSKPHIGCKKKKKTVTHTSICTHTHTARVSKMRNEKSRYVRQFHQFCLFFVYQNLGNLLPKFYFWKTKKHRWKEKKTPVPEEEKTQKLNCWEIL